MKTSSGSPAGSELERLERELTAQMVATRKLGALDREWFQKTVRWLVEWAPNDDLTLIAALGGIARAERPDPP
jgi:hypothetical protein